MLKKILLIALCFLSIGVRAELYTGGVADVTNGLVAHWKLDELSYNGTAGEVKDSSGNGNNGTSYGGVFTNPGKINRSGYFKGKDTYIDLGQCVTYFACTYSLWINVHSVIAAENYIIHTGSWLGDIKASFNISSGLTLYCITTGRSKSLLNISQNRWYHICVSYDLTSTRFYIDGYIIADDPSFIMSSCSNDYFHLGGLREWSHSMFDGLIDDVRIYNRAITSNEVKRLYNLGTPKKETVAYQFPETPYEMLPTNGLVAHWKLDEMSYNGTAGEVIDSSGNGKHCISYKKVITNPGQIKRAAYFDGSGASIYSNGIYLPTNNTMSGWVKIPRPVHNGTLFGYGSGNWPTCSFYTRIEPNRLQFGRYDYISNPVEVNGGDLVVVNGIDINTWYFLAVTSTNFISTVYLNGIDVGVVNYETYEYALRNFSIGSFLNWNLNAGESIVDDVRIYNRALTQEEVMQIYKARPIKEFIVAAYQGNKLVSNPLKKNYGREKWVNPYVTDGLVAMWDGEWNAGRGTHDPNATVWKDLVNNTDIQITDAGRFNDHKLVCDGSGYAGTAEWGNANSVRTIQVLCGNNLGTGRYIELSQNIGLLSLYNYTQFYVSSIVQPKVATITPNNTLISVLYGEDFSATVYSNNVIAKRSSGTITSLSSVENRVTIGGRYTPNLFVSLLGEIRSIRLYDRQLTQPEIAHNYSIDKARFGL